MAPRRRNLRIAAACESGTPRRASSSKRKSADARVFKIGERSAGENGFACSTMPGDFEQDRVGKTRETHGLKLSGSQAQLDSFRASSMIVSSLTCAANQACDFVARIEWLVAAAIDFRRRNAARVGKSGLPRGGELRNFGRGDIERFQLLDRVVVHTGGIERLRIKWLDGVAADHGQHEGQHDRRKRIAPDAKRCVRVKAGCPKVTHMMIVRARRGLQRSDAEGLLARGQQDPFEGRDRGRDDRGGSATSCQGSAPGTACCAPTKH